jgi:glycine cleavage system H protein
MLGTGSLADFLEDIGVSQRFINFEILEEAMSAILALLTAIVLITIGVLRGKRASASAAPVIVKRYYHPGHTWMRVTEDGEVVVGVDEFAQSVIGSVDGVRLPGLLKSLHQGDVAWHVWHGHRLVPMVSPVSGRVIEKNEMVLHNPSLINTSPYGDGWLLRVRPYRLHSQLRNLFSGKWALAWQDLARQQLGRLFAGTPALMYQDGGVLLKDLSDRCSDAEWDAIREEFFLSNGKL